VFDVSEQQGRREVSDRQELIRRFAVAIAGGHHIGEYLRHEIPHDMIWRIAEFLADGEQPQPQPPADNRIERALQVLREALRHPGNADGWSEGWEMVQQAVQILEGSDD
jgi:cytochrome c-type biogenesis protein CcmH/NrfG